MNIQNLRQQNMKELEEKEEELEDMRYSTQKKVSLLFLSYVPFEF